MNPAAQYRNITKRFGDFTAVDDVSLDIPTGHLTTLLGPSGCGKTTSLRMLAGYERPTSGQVFIAGKDATNFAPEKRNLGMVFQSYALFPHMTTRANVAYGLKLRKVKGDELRARVAEALDLVGLGEIADKKPKQMSGGQQQRVALARAIAIRPDVLLLDEPLSNLDARRRVMMRSEIRRIQSETGLTVVLVTHDQDEALEMSDVMVVMSDGRVEQAGSPTAVFSSPRNPFVARFLGYENIISLPSGINVTFRPEHLKVIATSEAADGIVLTGRLAEVAFRGVDVLVTVDVDMADEPVHAIVRPDELPMALENLQPGAGINLHANQRHLVTLTP